MDTPISARIDAALSLLDDALVILDELNHSMAATHLHYVIELLRPHSGKG